MAEVWVKSDWDSRGKQGKDGAKIFQRFGKEREMCSSG